MTNSTNQTITDKQEQIEAWVKQGVDRETATRVANASVRKVRPVKGNLNTSNGFSLLK